MELQTTESIIENISNTKYFPSTMRVSCNDKLTKILFSNTSFRNKTLGMDEKFHSRKKQEEKIVTKFKVLGVNSLDELERAVFDICISEQLAGNCFTTISAIYRALIGQVGNQNVRPMKNQFGAIVKAIEKLMAAEISFQNIGDNLKILGYTKSNANFSLQSSNILPAVLFKETSCRVNGKDTEFVLYFHCLSPIFEIANLKSQILRYPHELFNVPNQNNTPRVIAIKSYVMRRITEIKAHRQLEHTITFDDVFTKCRMENSPRNVKMDARNAIVKLFEHLKENNFISDFELVKNSQTQKIVSIKFSS